MTGIYDHMEYTEFTLPSFIAKLSTVLVGQVRYLRVTCEQMLIICVIRITDAPTAEARMLALVEWYLLSFHAGRQVRTPSSSWLCFWMALRQISCLHSGGEIITERYIVTPAQHGGSYIT